MPRLVLAALAAIVCFQTGSPARAIDLADVERELAGNGALGWIHGAVSDRSLYVFTYRNPADFFDYAHISLIADGPGVAEQLATLSRHDRVRIRGAFANNPSPQPHVLVKSLDVVQRWRNPYDPEPYPHDAEVPKDLQGRSEAEFLVHAIGGAGRILVAEYRDQIVPIYVRNGALTRGLSRNDVVRLRFRIRAQPGQPTHLSLLESEPNAVTVLQSIADFHGKPAVREGALVLFPQSPEISLDVFALDDEEWPDARRQFTLVNMQDPAVFAAIRAKLKAAWDRRPDQFVNGRNKLISTCIKVRARGVFNQVSASQANAQILLASADDVDVVDLCAPAE